MQFFSVKNDKKRIRATPRRGRRVEANLPENHLPAHFLYQMHNTKIHISKSATLKMWVKVMMYDICNGAIQWPISISIKVVPEHLSLAVIIFQILHICIFPEILWPWKYRSSSWCTTFAMTTVDGKCSTFYLMAK